MVNDKPRSPACEKLSDAFLDRDAFGQGFTFTLPNGKETYNTWCGVFLTFFIYIILGGYGYMKLHKVIEWGDSSVN